MICYEHKPSDLFSLCSRKTAVSQSRLYHQYCNASDFSQLKFLNLAVAIVVRRNIVKAIRFIAIDLQKHWVFSFISCNPRSLWRHRKSNVHQSRRVGLGMTIQYCRVPKNGGVDGSSLDRSYFSRLQPISFLLFNESVFESRSPSSLKRANGMWRRMLGWAENVAETFQTVEVELFRSQQCRRRSRLHGKRSLSVVKPFSTHFSSLGSFLFLDEIPAWPFFGKPFFGIVKWKKVQDKRLEVPCRKKPWRSPGSNLRHQVAQPIGSTALYRLSQIPIYKNRWFIGEF